MAERYRIKFRDEDTKISELDIRKLNTKEIKDILSQGEKAKIELAKNPTCMRSVLKELAQDESNKVKLEVAKRKDINNAICNILYLTSNEEVRKALKRNPKFDADNINEYDVLNLLKYKNTPDNIIEFAINNYLDKSTYNTYFIYALWHKVLKKNIVDALVNRLLKLKDRELIREVIDDTYLPRNIIEKLKEEK